MAELPLFPLRTVLFPDGLLELRIFEARYLDLMSRSLRERTPFGVVALRAGSEARSAAGDDAVRLYDVGTLAELIDVDSAEAGILLVRCRGGERFKLGDARQERDGLWVAPTEPVAPDARVEPAAAHADAVQALVEEAARHRARREVPGGALEEVGACVLHPGALRAGERVAADEARVPAGARDQALG